MSEPEVDPIEKTRRAPAWLAIAGVAIGFLGCLCGIGGGLFAVPILHYLVKIPLKQAVATGLVLVVATTSASTGTEAFQEDPDLVWPAIAALVVGVLLGAQLGFRVSERINVRVLRWFFVFFLSLAGWRVWAGGGGEVVPDAELILHWSFYPVAFLVGIGGGFVAPLLGVGGGLLMVPGLYLALPAIGFPGARACALAAGVVGSIRSLRLHARAGRVHWIPGLTLGIGALFGATAGVFFLRIEGFAEVGRPILAVVLWFVAGRFLVDQLKSRGEAPSK